MTKEARRSYSAPALEKGLDIIELLSAQEVGLSQSEIARALNRSVGEIFRMLMVLEHRGWVVEDPATDRYVLTTYIFEVANRIPKIGRLTAFAGPVMQRLTRATNQSAHLAIMSDDGVLVVGQLNSPGNNQLGVRIGARIDLWRASSGRVILAFLPPEELDGYIARVPLPPNTDEATLRADLSHIRRTGCEVRDSFVLRGIVNIAAPIIDHSGIAVAALTIPHVERYGETVTFDDCKVALVSAASDLTISLGGIPPGPSTASAEPSSDG